MPDKSQGFQEKPGEESSQVSLVPDIMVISGDGNGKTPGKNILELGDLSQTTDGVNPSTHSSDVNILQSGLSESQVCIEVGVVKTAQAPEPLKANSLLKGTGVTLQALDHNAPLNSSSERLQTDNSASSQMNGCCSMKSSPGCICTSFSTDLCEEELSQLDRSSLEKTSPVCPVNFSEPSMAANRNGKYNTDKKDLNVNPKAENSFIDSTSALPDVSLKVHQTRDSIDVRWDKEDRDVDRRSTNSRRTVKEGMCCCYQAFNRAFLQCVEETPAMLSGLVLSLAFCVAIIVLIPTTGRVRLGHCVRACVCACVHTCVMGST